MDDTLKLDTVRELLREKNITEAKKYGKVYMRKPDPGSVPNLSNKINMIKSAVTKKYTERKAIKL